MPEATDQTPAAPRRAAGIGQRLDAGLAVDRVDAWTGGTADR